MDNPGVEPQAPAAAAFGPAGLARFDRDVISHHPDLVLWQVGSNSVLLGHPTPGETIRQGVEQLRDFFSTSQAFLTSPRGRTGMRVPRGAPGGPDRTPRRNCPARARAAADRARTGRDDLTQQRPLLGMTVLAEDGVDRQHPFGVEDDQGLAGQGPGSHRPQLLDAVLGPGQVVAVEDLDPVARQQGRHLPAQFLDEALLEHGE